MEEWYTKGSQRDDSCESTDLLVRIQLLRQMKKTSFKVPIYDCKVVYIVTRNFKKAAKSMKQKLRGDANDNCGIAFRLNNDCLKYIIMVKPKYKKSWDTISHEALHTANAILDDRGIGVSLSNDEAQAYLMGYIIGKIEKRS